MGRVYKIFGEASASGLDRSKLLNPLYIVLPAHVRAVNRIYRHRLCVILYAGVLLRFYQAGASRVYISWGAGTAGWTPTAADAFIASH